MTFSIDISLSLLIPLEFMVGRQREAVNATGRVNGTVRRKCRCRVYQNCDVRRLRRELSDIGVDL